MHSFNIYSLSNLTRKVLFIMIIKGHKTRKRSVFALPCLTKSIGSAPPWLKTKLLRNVQYFWSHVTSVYQGLCFPYQSLWNAQRRWVQGWRNRLSLTAFSPPSQRRGGPFRALAWGEGTNSARLFTPGKRKALAKSRVHQWSRAREYGSLVDLLTDLKNMAVYHEWISTQRILFGKLRFTQWA